MDLPFCWAPPHKLRDILGVRVTAVKQFASDQAESENNVTTARDFADHMAHGGTFL